jgi:hypothetical protein
MRSTVLACNGVQASAANTKWTARLRVKPSSRGFQLSRMSSLMSLSTSKFRTATADGLGLITKSAVPAESVGRKSRMYHRSDACQIQRLKTVPPPSANCCRISLRCTGASAGSSAFTPVEISMTAPRHFVRRRCRILEVGEDLDVNRDSAEQDKRYPSARPCIGLVKVVDSKSAYKSCRQKNQNKTLCFALRTREKLRPTNNDPQRTEHRKT